MRRYMCMHTLPSGALTLEQICRVGEAAQHDPKVRGYRSFFNLAEGKAFCVLESTDRESLAAWFQEKEIPYDYIVPVEVEGERGEVHDLREELVLAEAI